VRHTKQGITEQVAIVERFFTTIGQVQNCFGNFLAVCVFSSKETNQIAEKRQQRHCQMDKQKFCQKLDTK